MRVQLTANFAPDTSIGVRPVYISTGSDSSAKSSLEPISQSHPWCNSADTGSKSGSGTVRGSNGFWQLRIRWHRNMQKLNANCQRCHLNASEQRGDKTMETYRLDDALDSWCCRMLQVLTRHLHKQPNRFYQAPSWRQTVTSRMHPTCRMLKDSCSIATCIALMPQTNIICVT